MPFISQESILEVKRAIDIHEIVSGYFPLKRKGANYWACCPFHDEKTPSFSIHPEKQIFKCFGCGKAGDVLTFVMEYEKVDYPEAVKLLASKAGVNLRYEGGASPGPGKDEVYKANEWASKLFRKLFAESPEGEAARKYLAGRGVNDETAGTFGIGYALDSWDHLLKRGRAQGFSEKILAAAGLVVEKEGRCYDRFRGRLIFPICDPRGKVIGFGARTLKDEEPKYINTPEGPAFSKGRNLFGLNLIRDEAERSRTLYIVEGYLDVILPYQAGIRGLVATLGTALTRDHLKILRRYVDKVVLVFDGDDAGRRASERGMDLLLSENVDLRIAELPAGHDPADVVVKLASARLTECLSRSTELFEYMLKTGSARVDLSTPSGKARVVEETLERLSQIPNEVKREVLLKQLADTFGLDAGVLRGRLRLPPEERAAPAPAAATGAVEKAARLLLAAMMAEAGFVAMVRPNLPAEAFPSEATRRIAAGVYAWADRGGAVSDVVSLLEKAEDRALAAELAAHDFGGGPLEPHVQGLLETLQSHRTREELRANRPKDDDEYLRKLEETRKSRGGDHRLRPGR